MREIKFRGMTANGDFVYGDLSHDRPNETVYYKEYSQRICWYVGAAHHNQPVKNGTVGQFTGLLDRDGKEIYEGDIVKTTSLVDEYSQRGATMTSPVEIWKGNACLTVTYVPIYPLCVNHIVEVIGNIYSNPELVEGVQ